MVGMWLRVEKDMDYEQLCGAIGLLKTGGIELDWPTLNDQMRELGRRVGIAQYGDPIAKTPPTGC
jgi:hypothetical protein